MSTPTGSGFIPRRIAVGLRDGVYRWWADAPPGAGGRVYREASGYRTAVFLMDGNDPARPWVWRPDPSARPENLSPWERRAVAAAVAFRRFSVIVKDLDDCRTWIVEAVLGGTGIVRLAREPESASVRWLARAGARQRLMGRVL